MRHLLCLMILLTALGQAAAQDMPLSQVLLPGETWQRFDGLPGTPGAILADGPRGLLVADAKEGVIRRVDADGKVAVFQKTTGAANGLTLGREGLRAAISGRTGGIFAYGRGEGEAIADVSARDVAISPQGRIYFTSPGAKGVFLVGDKAPLVSDLADPGGLVVSPDGGTLVVGEAGGSHLVSFRIKKDGRLDARERYAPLRTRPGQPSGVRQLTFDGSGRLYAATREGVQVFDPTGRLSGVLLSPARDGVKAVALSGDRLYVVCDGKIWWRKTRTRGLPSPRTGS